MVKYKSKTSTAEDLATSKSDAASGRGKEAAVQERRERLAGGGGTSSLDAERRLRLRRSATALATVGACEKWKSGKVQEWEGGGVWDEGLEAAADGHEKEI